MTKFFALLLAFTLHLSSWAFQPQLTLKGIELIGLKNIDDKGFILLSKLDGDQINIQRIDAELKDVWISPLQLEKPKGYSFHKLEIFNNSKFIYITDQLDKVVTVFCFDIRSGESKYKIQLSEHANTEQDKLFANADKDGFVFLDHVKDKWVLHRIDNLLEHSSEEQQFVVDFKPEHVINIQKDKLQIFSSEVNAEHTETDFKLVQIDLSSGDTLSHHYDLDLENTSFTYNSIVDHRIFSFYSVDDELYLLGKLDHRFNRPYPTTKNTEAFLGFWIAKINSHDSLVYLSEIPFQYFQGMVTNDMVVRAAVIDLKKDVNDHLFITINERKQVLYGKKYVINLDTAGKFTTFIGGQDEYHFYEFNDNGLHKGGKKLKLRLMNDDWSFYSNSSLHMLRFTHNAHSIVIKQISEMYESSALLPSEAIYTFSEQGNRSYIFEYLDQKGGTLNIYKRP